MSQQHVIVGFSGEAIRTLVLGTVEGSTFLPILAYGYRDELEGPATLVKAFKAFLNEPKPANITTLYPLQAFAQRQFGTEVPLVWASKPGFFDFLTPQFGRLTFQSLAA